MSNTKKLTLIGMLSAMAYIVMLAVHVKVFNFLTFDPKDAVISVGGFILGPFTAFLISFVVSLIEMFTVSETAYIGFFMNLISTSAFACTAAFVYKKVHTYKGAVIGLVLGIICSTAMMLLWNYIVTPFYMGVPREQVAAMLPTVFLPFNLVKGIINMALSLMIYKPLITVLRNTGIVMPSKNAGSGKFNIWMYLVGVVLLVIGIAALIMINSNAG
ncbi:MAG: ECF transporter S component [Firmicutes bacterium]|nr:ECF transporter S component [Bacillota bacterium]